MTKDFKDVSIFHWLKRKISKRIARRKVKWRNFKAKYFSVKRDELDIDKKKIIDLFVTFLKDKNATLNYSPESHSRFIQSDFLWASMTPAKGVTDSVINIVDESIPDNPHSHEFLIPDNYAREIKGMFDDELEKRFKALENEKRNVVAVDIDKLILKIKESK